MARNELEDLLKNGVASESWVMVCGFNLTVHGSTKAAASYKLLRS